MGQTCCKDVDDHSLLIDIEDMTNMYDFQLSEWPQDPNLKKLLQKSFVVPDELKQKPHKHKYFERYYWGEWIDGKPKGKGIYYLCQNGKKLYYEGEINGQPNGLGHVIFNDGQWQYQGNVINGQANGKGKMKNRKQGYKFEGQWKDSKPYKGTLILKQRVKKQDKSEEIKRVPGDIIIQMNEENHESVVRYPDGRIYTGEIDKKRFLPHGMGKVVYPDKTQYIGEWYQGQMHGTGKFQWSDGSCYSGDYMFGKKHGNGRFQFNNGKVYKGRWAQGKQHGHGILYSKQGQVLKKGLWKHGEFTNNK